MGYDARVAEALTVLAALVNRSSGPVIDRDRPQDTVSGPATVKIPLALLVRARDVLALFAEAEESTEGIRQAVKRVW